jgi:hypothetical protein
MGRVPNWVEKGDEARRPAGAAARKGEADVEARKPPRPPSEGAAIPTPPNAGVEDAVAKREVDALSRSEDKLLRMLLDPVSNEAVEPKLGAELNEKDEFGVSVLSGPPLKSATGGT